MPETMYEFIRTHNFNKQWKSLGLTEDDLLEVEVALSENPTQGDIIVGGNGLRKMRIALDNRGKSGSARIAYIEFVIQGKIYLYRVYAKNQQENLSQRELNEIAKEIEELKRAIKKGE